uniref:Uncharacterized protein n=1 Tax=Ditylenchus dipsaci TaxID=166011 RepID=A0A915E356_9BILA
MSSIEPVAVITLDDTIDLHDADLLDELRSDKYTLRSSTGVAKKGPKPCSLDNQCRYFEHDLLIRADSHHSALVISGSQLMKGRLDFYDSMHGDGEKHLSLLKDFLKEFAVEGGYDEVNPSLWIGACAKDIPTQSN